MINEKMIKAQLERQFLSQNIPMNSYQSLNTINKALDRIVTLTFKHTFGR